MPKSIRRNIGSNSAIASAGHCGKYRLSTRPPRFATLETEARFFAVRSHWVKISPGSSRLRRTISACVAAIFLCSMAAIRCAALDPNKTLTQYAHRVLGQEEGLFQPTIYSILQTRDGFLWLGTQDSLIRFDGVHFREVDESGRSLFHRSLIRALAEDNAGDLWVGSIGSGIAEITPSGAIKHYTVKQGLPSDNVFCIAAESKDDV